MIPLSVLDEATELPPAPKSPKAPKLQDYQPITSFEARSLTSALRDLANVQRLALQQTYTMNDLLEMYHGLSPEGIKELARQHAGWQGKRGRSLVLSLYQVELINQAIALGVGK